MSTVLTSLAGQSKYKLKSIAKKILRRMNAQASTICPTSTSSVVNFRIPERNTNARIKYAYLGNDKALVDVHYDAALVLDLTDNSVAPTILRTGWWEPWIDILINSVVQPGNTTIDVGANFGYHTNLQAKLVGEHGQVYAFECNPQLVSCLIRSIWISGFSNRITLYQAAVADKMGEIEMTFSPTHLGGGQIVDRYDTAVVNVEHGKIDWKTCWGEIESVKVKLVSLDTLLGNKIDEIDFFHADAEGAEPMIFAGAEQLIKRSRNLKIITEWSVDRLPEETKQAHYQMIKNLEKDNFKFYLISPPSGDVYCTPPDLKRLSLDEIMKMPHCDIFMTRE